MAENLARTGSRPGNSPPQRGGWTLWWNLNDCCTFSIWEHALVSRAPFPWKPRRASDPVKLVANKDLGDQELRIYSLWRHRWITRCLAGEEGGFYSTRRQRNGSKGVSAQMRQAEWFMVLLVHQKSIVNTTEHMNLIIALKLKTLMEA